MPKDAGGKHRTRGLINLFEGTRTPTKQDIQEVRSQLCGSLHPHIITTPGVRGGRPCIAGTRLTVMDIVALHLQGTKPEEMLEFYSSRTLTLAEVHSALAYYYDHKDEVDAVMREDLRLFEEGYAAQEKSMRERSGRS